MGTATLALVNWFFILQVAHSTPPGVPTDQWRGTDPGQQGAVPTSQAFNNLLDEFYETQLPPPPTMEDVRRTYGVEEKTTKHVTTGDTKTPPAGTNSQPENSKHLETNEIVKKPEAPPKSSLGQGDTNNNNANNAENIKGQTIIANKLYNNHENNNIKNSLTKSEMTKEATVSITNVYNKPVKTESNSKDKILDQHGSNKLYIIFKLKNYPSEKDMKYLQKEDKNIQKSESQALEKEGKESQVQDQNEGRNDDEGPSCGCVDDCKEEVPQDQAENKDNMPLDQVNQQKYEGEHDIKPKLLTHFLIILRNSKGEKFKKRQAEQLLNLPLHKDGLKQHPLNNLKQTNENLPILKLLLSLNALKSTSRDITPFTYQNENKPREQISAGMTGCKNEDSENSVENNRAEDEDTTSEMKKRALYTRFRYPESIDQNLSVPDGKLAHISQTLQDRYLMFKRLDEIIRYNALRKIQEEQLFKEISSFPSEESPNASVLLGSRIVLTKPKNQPLPHELLPLYFPKENSGVEIKHIEDYPDFQKLIQQHEDDSGDTVRDELTKQAQPPPNGQQQYNSDVLTQFPADKSSQEMPWFIKHIIDSFNYPAEEDNLQPPPSQLAPLQKPNEEDNAALLRPLLFPFSL